MKHSRSGRPPLAPDGVRGNRVVWFFASKAFNCRLLWISTAFKGQIGANGKQVLKSDELGKLNMF